MKKSHVGIVAFTIILTLMMGMVIGTKFFSRTQVLGKQELQDHIYKITDEITDFFEDNGFKVNQSYIVGKMWIQCDKLGDFFILARALGVDTIYLHWKKTFLDQPIFFILRGKTAITYEPY